MLITTIMQSGILKSKTHRQNETWQYRYLDTTRSNLIAYRIATLTKIGQRNIVASA